MGRSSGSTKFADFGYVGGGTVSSKRGTPQNVDLGGPAFPFLPAVLGSFIVSLEGARVGYSKSSSNVDSTTYTSATPENASLA